MGQENYSEMRKAMIVSQLRTSDVNDPRIIAAMGSVAREDFVPAAARAIAYVDRGVDLDGGRRLNPPVSQGMLLRAARLQSGDHVLLVGAASGYLAAVIAHLAGSVVALEESGKLITRAKNALGDAHRIQLEKGKLIDGYAKAAPYDAILVDGAIEQLPDTFADQLKEGGRLAAGLVQNGVAKIAAGTKAGGMLGLTDIAEFPTAPLPGFAIEKTFAF